MPSYQCLENFCPIRSETPGYCPKHRAERKAARDKHYDQNFRNKEDDAFLRTAAWLKLRELVLSKHHLCQFCNKTLPTDVHHIKARKRYPHLALTESNCMALCAKCHKRIEVYRSSTKDYDGLPEKYSEE